MSQENKHKTREDPYERYKQGYPYDGKQYDGRGNLVKTEETKRTYREIIFK